MALSSAPPPALSKEEFEKRIADGAETIQEIDPAFAAWIQAGQRFDRTMVIVLVGLVLIACFVVAVCVLL